MMLTLHLMTQRDQPYGSVRKCCDTLMYELIVAEGQEPQVIESWNVPATPKGGAV